MNRVIAMCSYDKPSIAADFAVLLTKRLMGPTLNLNEGPSFGDLDPLSVCPRSLTWLDDSIMILRPLLDFSEDCIRLFNRKPFASTEVL